MAGLPSLSDWITANELSDSAVDVLKAEGLLNIRALLLVKESDLKDIQFTKGDFLLVRAAVQALQAEQKASAAKPKSGEMTLDDLLGQGAAQDGSGAATRGGGLAARADLDPSFYLANNKGGSAALKVTDFISAAGFEPEEVDLGGGISLKLAGQKPKLEKVSPAMWMAANGRIMAELIERGDLATMHDILDYVAYTVKIGEMACRFTWASVLTYDNEYRSLQAAADFRWGADTPHLSTVSLREKATPGQRQSNSVPAGINGPAAPRRRPVTASGREICLQWNRGHCTFGQRCNFEHCCLTCGREHSAKDHSNATVFSRAATGQPAAAQQ